LLQKHGRASPPILVSGGLVEIDEAVEARRTDSGCMPVETRCVSTRPKAARSCLCSVWHCGVDNVRKTGHI